MTEGRHSRKFTPGATAATIALGMLGFMGVGFVLLLTGGTDEPGTPAAQSRAAADQVVVAPSQAATRLPTGRAPTTTIQPRQHWSMQWKEYGVVPSTGASPITALGGSIAPAPAGPRTQHTVHHAVHQAVHHAVRPTHRAAHVAHHPAKPHSPPPHKPGHGHGHNGQGGDDPAEHPFQAAHHMHPVHPTHFSWPWHHGHRHGHEHGHENHQSDGHRFHGGKDGHHGHGHGHD